MVVMIVLLFICSSFFFFKQKTAYEMRISDWSSDVCSSDLLGAGRVGHPAARRMGSGTLSALGPARAAAARLRAAARRHSCGISRTQPPVGQGARVHRFSGRLLDRKSVV